MLLIPASSIPVRAALLAVATDLPALRKITQFLGHKADFGCHMCKIRALREPGTIGASGRMSYYTPSSCERRQDEEVRQQANEFRQARSKKEAGLIAQRNGVRYTELVRLPYFDTVRMSCVDPMHTFLLGMVRRETELNLAMLSPTKKNEFLRRMKLLKLPYDIGRLPTNIFDGSDSLGHVTAQQWKNYVIIFARPCMFKLLPDDAYKSLVLLSQIVSLVASPIFTLDDVASLYRHLHDHHSIFYKVYGKWAVTINYHMSLHIPDLIIDQGPPQAFWCFAYERMNGTLSRTPNSNRLIEVEVMDRHLRDYTFCSYSMPTEDVPRSLREILYEDEEVQIPSTLHSHWIISHFLMTIPERRFSRQQGIDKGDVVDWPLEMLHPSKKNVRITPDFHEEIKTFFHGLYGAGFTYAPPRIHKYGRCTVNGQTFSSNLNSTDRSCIVKSMFVDNTNKLEPYFGIVRFFFTVTPVIQGQPKFHNLAYVTWLKFRGSTPEPLSHLHTVTKDLYLADRILSPRRFPRRCCLLSPQVSESFFFVSELPK